MNEFVVNRVEGFRCVHKEDEEIVFSIGLHYFVEVVVQITYVILEMTAEDEAFLRAVKGIKKGRSDAGDHSLGNDAIIGVGD